MRSPAVAFSLLAAATAVSVSASSLQSPSGLDSTTLSPKLGAIDLNGPGLNHAHRRDAGTGLGISEFHASPSTHSKRAPIGRPHNSDSINARPEALTHSAPRPEPPEHAEGGAIGCNNPDIAPEESAAVAHDLYTSGNNGGVSCSSSSQGASADEGGQDGLPPDAKSPDAGSTPDNTVLNSGIGAILRQSGGTSTSGSATGGNADPSQDNAPAFGAYPGYGGARTAPQVTRRLTTRTSREGEGTLHQVGRASTAALTARSTRYGTFSDCDEDDTECGLAGQSIYGDAIPGNGPQGGGAYPGTPGSSNGGQVIESGDIVESGSNTNTPGAEGISRSGNAEGGDARF